MIISGVDLIGVLNSHTTYTHARVFEILDFIGQMLSRDAIAVGPERASNVR